MTSTFFSVVSKLVDNKDIEELNDTTNQLDLINLYRTLHSTKAEHSLLKGTWDFHQDRPYPTSMNLNKFKKLKSYKICSQTTECNYK